MVVARRRGDARPLRLGGRCRGGVVGRVQGGGGGRRSSCGSLHGGGVGAGHDGLGGGRAGHGAGGGGAAAALGLEFLFAAGRRLLGGRGGSDGGAADVGGGGVILAGGGLVVGDGAQLVKLLVRVGGRLALGGLEEGRELVRVQDKHLDLVDGVLQRGQLDPLGELLLVLLVRLQLAVLDPGAAWREVRLLVKQS